jgi:hypothetical protein
LILMVAIYLTVWVVALLLSHYKVPAELRSVARWMAAGGLLFAATSLLSQIASQEHWTPHSSALGGVDFLLPVAGAVCCAVAAFSALRLPARRRGPDRARVTPGPAVRK